MKSIVESSYPEALDKLVTALRAKPFSPDRYTLVLTPDRYTLSVEKALFCGRAAIDCEVLTLSRLCKRVIPGQTLSREGGVMLVSRAIAEVKGELAYYSHAAKFPDFAREVFETILQVESSCADLSALPAHGVTRKKLDDLALIKNAYDRLKSERSDAADRLTALIASAKDSELICSSDIYAIGYSNATKLNRAVFEALSKAARSFTFIDAYPPEETPLEVECWHTGTAVDQYKFVAARIRDYVYKGGAYGDVAVVCPDPKTLSRILREYKIDFYADNACPLSDTPPLTAISSAFALHLRGNSDDLAALVKNPYSGVDTRDAEKLCNYLVSHRLDYGALSAEIDDADARRAQQRARELVGVFDGSGFAECVDGFMEKADFDGVARALERDVSGIAGDDDLVMTDMISPVRELVDLIRRYGGEGEDKFEVDSAAFFSAARAVEIKSLPRFRDRVTVCMPGSLRMSRPELLFITDFNEGILPRAIADAGLLSDAELGSLSAVEPTVRERNRRERVELVAVMKNAKKTVCTYSTAGGGKRAALLSALVRDDSDYGAYLDGLKSECAPEFVARLACAAPAAREFASRGVTAYSDALRAAVGNWDRVSPAFCDHVDGIKLSAISVTELSAWFACPYKRFLADSVGLKERATGALSAPDFGNILHGFMKKFVERGGISDGEVASTVKEVIIENGIAVTELEFERIVRDACDFAADNLAVIEAGDYRPVPELAEFAFGGKVLLGKSSVPLVGYIDRADQNGDMVRVIDYKTNSSKKFEFDACRDGRDLQLPLYAADLSARGKTVTGMFFVPLRSAYDDDGRLRGCVVNDFGVLKGYDHALGSGKSEILPINVVETDGGYRHFGSVNSRVLDKADFDAFIAECVDTASLAADEIESGYIERSPIGDACKFCAYRGLCDNKKPRVSSTDSEEEQ